MMYRIRNWLVATLLLLCAQVGAATLSDIQVSNGNQQARITLSFIGDPDYAFSHQSKRTVALDIKQTGVIQGLPLLFSGNNLVKAIRSGTPKDAQTLRLVVDLTENGKTEAVKRQNGSNYTVVFTINADAYCHRAKALLSSKGVSFQELPIDGNAAKREEMIKRSGRTTVPQIFIDAQHIGGCDDLYALDARGGLDPLLK